MSLVFPNDGRIVAGPGTHAFIVGVSDYANLPDPGVIGSSRQLGLKKLSSPALSAWQVSEWLIKNGADLAQPLASVRLLLAPSLLEQQAEPALNGNFTRPTWDNFAEQVDAWRTECCSDPKSIAFFYFSGHGSGLLRDNLVMLMEDFGKKIGAVFDNAVELSNLVNGMAPGEPPADTIARTQLYFIDACRSDELDDVAKSQPIHAVFQEVSGRDDRNRPILLSTLDGAVALGRKGEVSHFCEALLRAFDTACDFSREVAPSQYVWPVTMESVRYSLQSQFLANGLTQRPFLQGGSATDLDIRILRKAPNYDLTLFLDPDTASCLDQTKIEVMDADDQPKARFPAHGCSYPYKMNLPMGAYDIVANGQRIKRDVPVHHRQKNSIRIAIA